jgi:hypothetical protein
MAIESKSNPVGWVPPTSTIIEVGGTHPTGLNSNLEVVHRDYHTKSMMIITNIYFYF